MKRKVFFWQLCIFLLRRRRYLNFAVWPPSVSFINVRRCLEVVNLSSLQCGTYFIFTAIFLSRIHLNRIIYLSSLKIKKKQYKTKEEFFSSSDLLQFCEAVLSETTVIIYRAKLLITSHKKQSLLWKIV